jgi:hypothetical protein
MSWQILKSCCLMAALGLGVPGVCQTSQPLDQEKGFTEVESIQEGALSVLQHWSQ